MRPKKSLGQNFLRNERIIDRIVSSLSISPGDVVVEIGPGRGALTEKLVAAGVRVIAIEIDRELVPVLRTQFHFDTNFSVIEGDILDFDLTELLNGIEPSKVKIVGNLPYYISTPIIQRLIDQRHSFSVVTLMLQREVAQRITAKPGNSQRGFLTVMVENAFQTENLFDVPPDSFFPAPKVWSAVVRMTPTVSDIEDIFIFRRLVSSSFAQKRKTILNNLKVILPDAAEILERSNIEPNRRAETLTHAEWKKLAGNAVETTPPASDE